ncbi:MAG TPA: hypothetical protein VHB54_10040 [Mucilaginibacter sp.]|nr:hypothetical protein [Mucilaginibacter sp.]
MATYTVFITLSDSTLQSLYAGKFWLRVYKGITASAPVVNTVWYTTNVFSSTVQIQWTDDYYGFIYPGVPLTKGTMISSGPLNAIQPGNVLSIGPAGSTSISTIGGNANALTFVNNSSNIRICGAAQPVNGNPRLYTAMQMMGSGTNVAAPKELLLLVFETGEFDAGRIVTRTLNSSLQINMMSSTPVTIAFDYQNSWDTNGDPNATILPNSISITGQLWSQYNNYIK